jgi:hypothetical protein
VANFKFPLFNKIFVDVEAASSVFSIFSDPNFKYIVLRALMTKLVELATIFNLLYYSVAHFRHDSWDLKSILFLKNPTFLAKTETINIFAG